MRTARWYTPHMMNRTPLSTTLIGIGVLLALHASAAPVGKSALPKAPAAPLRMNSKTEGERFRRADARVRTCEETGLCALDKQRLILGSKSPKEVFSALLKGCKSKRWLNDDVVLECPESVSLPGATPERVFATQDIFSAAQVIAAPLHQQDIKGAGVRVAVLDTGIAANHPELSGRIVGQASFIEGSDATDGHGHGTHVAGIVAGQGIGLYPDDNGDNRVMGTSPRADLLIGKVCNDSGWCPEGSILAGLEWAVTNGAKVINLSVGGGAFLAHCDSDTLASKANWASNQGVTVVVASGNGAAQNPGVSTPGCASLAIAVGAVDRNDVRQPWSGNGPALDVTAPGLGILSALPCAISNTCPEAGRGWWSGTSMASPHVAGVAALVRGVNPSLTPAEVRDVLILSAHDLGNVGFDDSYGFGRMDAAAAVARARDFDGDGSQIPADCADRNPLVSPLMSEICGNGKDDNCSGQTDEGCVSSSSNASATTSFVSSAVSASSLSSVPSASSAPSSAAWNAPSSAAASSASSFLEPPRSSADEEEEDHEESSEDRNQKDNTAEPECRTHWWDPLLPWSRCTVPTPPGWERPRPIAIPPGQEKKRDDESGGNQKKAP